MFSTPFASAREGGGAGHRHERRHRRSSTSFGRLRKTGCLTAMGCGAAAAAGAATTGMWKSRSRVNLIG